MAATYVETHHGTSTIVTEKSTAWQERASGAFWFSVCLILFMVLGPFAAPIALVFLFSNNLLSSEMTEPESVNEGEAGVY